MAICRATLKSYVYMIPASNCKSTFAFSTSEYTYLFLNSIYIFQYGLMLAWQSQLEAMHYNL